MNLKYFLILIIVCSCEFGWGQSISEIYLKKIQAAKELEKEKNDIKPNSIVSPIVSPIPPIKKTEEKEAQPPTSSKIVLMSTITNESFTLKTIDKSTSASSTLVSKNSNKFRLNLDFESEKIGYGIFYEYHPFEILQNNQASTWIINNRKNTARSMGANLEFKINEINILKVILGVDDSFFVRTINNTNLTIDMFYSEFLSLNYSHIFKISPNLKFIPEFQITNHFASSKDTYSIKNGESASMSLGIENHFEKADCQLKSFYSEKYQETAHSKDRIRLFGIGLGLKINF